MVKLDRIEHTVTIPEGVTANISEDGVVTITGPKGTLTRAFENDVVQLFQDGSGLIVRGPPSTKATSPRWNLERPPQQHGEGRYRRLHLQPQGLLFSLPNDVGRERQHLPSEQLLW